MKTIFWHPLCLRILTQSRVELNINQKNIDIFRNISYFVVNKTDLKLMILYKFSFIVIFFIPFNSIIYIFNYSFHIVVQYLL